MKLYKSIFAMLAVAAISGAFVSCDDDLDRPPVIIPEATYEVNTAIADFKQMFWSYQSASDFTQIPLTADGDSMVIGGRIVSRDDSGNMYKQIVIQDESGAVLIGVNASDLNAGRYKYGEEVRVNVTGLYVGNYNGLLQIGQPYNGAIGRIDEELMNLHAQCNGLPDLVAVDNLMIATDNIATVNAWAKNQTDMLTYMSCLLKLENVSFEGGGELLWSDDPGGDYYTTRRLVDAAGNAINVNTSNKCTFASQTLPAGTGTVTAILSYFRDDWQLVVCDPALDCTGFLEIPADNKIFSAPLNSGTDGFTVENIVAPAAGEVWNFSSQYKCMVATGYINGTNNAADSWFISPVIDLTDTETAYATFQHALNYFSSIESASNECTFNVREEGASEWTKLTVNYPSALGFTFISSGDVDLSAFTGKRVEFGFHYTSTASKAGTWEVNNFTVKRQCIGEPNIPGSTPSQPEDPTPADGVLYAGLSADDATIDWTFESNSVEGVSEIWTWKEYSNSHYLNGSAFVSNVAYASTAYACSPVIDLTAAKSAKMTFEHAAKFQTTLLTLCGAVVREEGASAWTELTIPTWPATGNWTFVSAGEIDLSAYLGKKIQVGFKYGSTAEGADTWEIKNLKITE